ncbi:Zn-ribbon domain-containing OB-fold protein [ANME-2 cluster archaeon]|nr:MAG: Zn-ribbon domain-containing OB-fold protein [ANME-2 cluster archaeon]
MGVPRFWRHISSRYNLIGTRCNTCGKYYFPPRTMCPNCRRDGSIEEYRFKGHGEVVTYTIIHTASEGFNILTPYSLAIIQLDEGPRMTGQVVCDPDEIMIGMRVKPVFRKLGEDGDAGIIYYGTKFIPA